MITREEALRRLSEIIARGNDGKNERSDASEHTKTNTDEVVQDAGATRSSEGARSQDSRLLDYYGQFGGRIVNDYILDSRQITRKEYLAMTRGLTQSQLLEHPLLYAFFRSEDQNEFNFFEWLGKFKK